MVNIQSRVIIDLATELNRVGVSIFSSDYRKLGKTLVFLNNRIYVMSLGSEGNYSREDRNVQRAVFGNNVETAVDAAFKQIKPIALSFSRASGQIKKYLAESGIIESVHGYVVYTRKGISYDVIIT